VTQAGEACLGLAPDEITAAWTFQKAGSRGYSVVIPEKEGVWRELGVKGRDFP